jgi:uncharacterized protein YndB with AHSA1/START domain
MHLLKNFEPQKKNQTFIIDKLLSMPTIFHDLYIEVPAAKVFKGISVPECLDEWWTNKCKGDVASGKEYELYFTPGYIWQATVTKCDPGKEFELTIHDSDADWDGTKVGFIVQEKGEHTKLQFYHSGWKEINEHFRVSSYCWATYLRILKQFLEKGTRVPYNWRDDV